ncbi:hypothetical protein Goarm_015195 [Gossypium armourianum]|uniref:S-protein homolog n=1 Tax=Gossypium armourianum TaxID=34283 RepID=A0A7J9J8R5_9ROSI|nr:hypothetical protein [Gossypium armourianum]
MGGGNGHVLVFLVSVFFFIISSSVDGSQYKQLSTIHVMNSMAKGSGPMQIRCKSRYTDYGMRQLGEGTEYRCGVREKAVYYCMGMTGRRIASWHAFQPRRDGNRKAVFWLVKENGIFLSWDNSTWVRKSDWETD